MYTNAQVASLVANLDARIARIEAAIVASGAPASAAASTPIVPASEALATAQPKVKARCATHDKTFTVTAAGAATGTGFHATWCDKGFEPVA